ncbi:MAG: DUF397 domain-containing protein [Micromonosporaceae bacterium]|nr:DUF397 domain-containing protein [Micromonosporaceae bacterium]
MTDLTGARWVKSTRSSNDAQCVEVAANLLAERGAIYVRDSKHPDGPALAVTAPDWSAFLRGAKHGDFDL